MSTAKITQRVSTPRFRSGLVVTYYLLALLTGAFILLFHGRVAFEADAIVTVFYIAATALLYVVSGPASGRKEH